MTEELFDKQKLIIENINEIKKKALPNGWLIDLDALENVDMGTGKKLSQKEILDLFFEKGFIISRGNPGIQQIDSPTQFQLAGLYNELVEVCEEIQKQHSPNADGSQK